MSKITKEEFLKAKELVAQYNQQVHSEVVKPFTCICCKTNPIIPGDYNSPNPLIQQDNCWDNGAVKLISFGWGSRLDLESFLFGICDDCMENLWKEKLVINLRELEKIMQKY